MSDRIKKKDLKKPDQLQTTAERLMEYARENRNRIIAASVAVLILIVLCSGWFAYGYYNERKAQELLGEAMAMPRIGPGAAEAAIRPVVDKHRKVVEQYPGTDAANLSRYSLGVLYYRLNEIDNAIKSYDDFLARADQNELKALAYGGLGYCYEAKGDYAAAYRNFELAAGNPDGAAFRGSSYLGAGRMAEQMKDSKKAVEAYKKALENKNDPATEMLLKRKVSELE